MFQMSIPARDPDTPPRVPYKDEKTVTDAKWIESLAHSKREPRFRVATPDKRTIHDLSQSFGKHRLGKQQRILQDLNLRCRVQEVADMSGAITKKMNCQLGVGNFPEKLDPAPSLQDISDVSTVATDDTTLSLFDRTHTKFPPTKRMLKSPRKYYQDPAINLPQLNIEHSKGVNKHTLELPLNKTNIVKDSAAIQINGRIQFDHYMNDKQNQFLPLVLPNAKKFQLPYGKDRIDSYVYSKKASLYSKGRFGSKSQWDLWSRHSDRSLNPASWQSKSQITIPSTSQSARE